MTITEQPPTQNPTLELDTSAFLHPPTAGSNQPLPMRRFKLGPITAAKLATTQKFYLTAATIGLILMIANLNSSFTALGLGLIWPGGGLLYGHHYFSGSLIFILFLISATANRYALPTIWLGSAALSMLFIGDQGCPHSFYGLPLLSLVLFGFIHVQSHIRYKKGLQKSLEIKKTLQANKPLTTRSWIGKIDNELSDEDLAHSKFILDRALQPLDEFNGLKELEPYGTSALRYQLNYAQYALAMYNYCHTPAFGGYLQEAQRRLIEKMTAPNAWRYWYSENMWGNLDSNPDPIRRDNIMFSGYLGQMLGMYQTVSGDNHYQSEDALIFQRNNKQSFPYNHTGINQKVFENFSASEFCLYPCEPNWSYTMCNPFGLNSLLMNDRLFGSNFFAQTKERYENNLRNEFMYADGSFVSLRSMLWGINIPGFNLDVNDGLSVFLHHPCLPDLAETCWEMMRYQHFKTNPKKHYQLKKKGQIDIGNYRHTAIGPYATLLLAAKEMGDMEVYHSVLSNIEDIASKTIKQDELVYKGLSNLTSFILAMAKFSRPAAFHDIITTGMPPTWQKGPQLLDAPYPQCLVYRAVTDGRALEIGIKTNTTNKLMLQLGQLIPNKQYRLHCENPHSRQSELFFADFHGRAQLSLHCNYRNKLFIHPVD